MSNDRFEFGDRVQHAKRPEWGIGSVIRTEEIAIQGRPTQRVAVRFPNVGLKMLVAGQAELKRVAQEKVVEEEPAGSRLETWEKLGESDWLGPLARRKIEEAMISLPESVQDPFIGLSRQLEATLKLYRFDRSGGSLIDWAVAQSGLDDPLSRFTRQDLERMFDRWTHERDAHLAKLLSSARHESGMIDRVARAAPAGARDAIRKAMAVAR